MQERELFAPFVVKGNMRHLKVAHFLGFVASLAVTLMLASPSPAWAGHDHRPKPPHGSHSAPEIDPAGLGAIASLLAGGMLLLKSRRGARPPG